MSEEKRPTSQPNIPFTRHGGPGARFAEVQHAENAGAALKRLLKYFAEERALLIAIFAVVILGTLFGIFAPSQQSDAIDVISGASDKSLAAALALMMTTYVLYAVSQFFRSYLSAKLSQRIVKRLRIELFEKITDLPIKYTDTHSHGDIMSRKTNDIENISNTVSQSLPSIFSGILTIIGTAAIMLWYCWQLALLSFVTVGLTVLATKILSKNIRKYSRTRQSFLGELNGTVEEMISGYHTVTAYNHQQETIDSFCETADKLTKVGIKTDIIGGVMGPVMNCIGNIGFVIITAFGGYFSLKGLITVGVISAFIVYAKQFSRPVNEIAQVYGQLQTAVAGAERVFSILDEPDEDMSGDDLPDSAAAEVEFRGVNFSYVEGKPVIKDFSLTVPSGKKVALVGSTGSGKTTVVNLLMRFYDIDSGDILINGKSILGMSRADLRKNIGIVLQDTTLFSDTVRNNLKYANESASDEDIMKAAQLTHSNAVIDALPHGYDTVLYGAGAAISQGQRQLLAIARTFSADPKILILDEATSNVDTRTEKAVQDAMQTLMKNRTSIVIAHRLSTIRDADIIIVMDHGRIAETGDHTELLNRRGKYYELYMTQFAGLST